MDRTAFALPQLLVAVAGFGKGGKARRVAKDSTVTTAFVSKGATDTVTLPGTDARDVPSTRDSALAAGVAHGKRLRMSFRAKGKVPECLAFYGEQLKTQGWILQPVMEMGGNSSLLKGMRDNRPCTVLFTPGGDETVVQVHASF